MSEGGRSRSSLSSIASSQRTLSADSSSSRRNSGIVTDESHGNYTESWIKNSSHTKSPELDTCWRIKDLEDTIDKHQVCAENCRKSIKSYQEEDKRNQGREYYHPYDKLVDSKRDFLKGYLEKITEAEKHLIQLGPCPISDCTRHHETVKDVVMADASQYSNYPLPISPTPPSELPTNNAFKQASPKKAARPWLEKPQSPIETSNRFQNLMDITENVNSVDSQTKITIPDINLKISADYNLTIQEISRNFPKTICKYNRGFIRISPHSHEDREKIIEFLDKSEKEYVLSEAPENRPIKIVIKNLPPDHSKELISRDLENNKFKVIRINQLRNFRLKTLLPIFLVELAKPPNANDIFQIGKINNFSVKNQALQEKAASHHVLQLLWILP
ncbi:hypothetical protein AVEN_2837-1 [Araneus ventricosus]|uniref:Pre-C2HC domain-containing protein n=1 Tax=Araneus ventricosus TaxID=182803 RepID=A0A4Y2EJH9_ARAVE|nr:hypothetical protein AVEN_2837-1 [Araneus ventricosus]